PVPAGPYRDSGSVFRWTGRGPGPPGDLGKCLKERLPAADDGMVFAKHPSHARQDRGGNWFTRIAAVRGAARPLGRTDAAMTRLPSSTVTWLTMGVVALIGLVDHWTGQLALGVFYVLPIAAATWYSGKRIGTVVSAGA